MNRSNCLPSKNTQQCYLQCQRMMGQQSLAEFLGLHLNIDAIYKKNKANRTATRKAGQIINTGDKLTAEQKQQKQAENQKEYGLTEEQIRDIKLPAPTAVQIFNVKKIVNAKAGLSTVEKINHLLELEKALNDKLLKLREIKAKTKAENLTDQSLKKNIPRTSSIEESGGDEEVK